MNHRRIAQFEVAEIGLGCMNLSHAYSAPPPADVAEALLLRAVDLGVNFFDTAALYGFGRNEALVGRVLKPHRSRVVLASKCGMTGVDGKRVIDGRPETIRRTCEESLARLQTGTIDLYYLHRWDKRVPIADSIGAMAELVQAGKVRAIGLSEVSAKTLRAAHAVHPIAAVQSEYSLWSREAEIGVLDACRELDIAFVAFSPLARGFLTGTVHDPSTFDQGDIRRAMPRFFADNYARNLQLLAPYGQIAAQLGCTPAQLALAWLLAKDDCIVPIPGTRSIAHLEENLGGAAVRLDAGIVRQLDSIINRHTVAGARYNAATQAEIDTETF